MRQVLEVALLFMRHIEDCQGGSCEPKRGPECACGMLQARAIVEAVLRAPEDKAVISRGAFEDWWDNVGCPAMPGPNDPPAHGWIAKMAWEAAIDKAAQIPDRHCGEATDGKYHNPALAAELAGISIAIRALAQRGDASAPETLGRERADAERT